MQTRQPAVTGPARPTTRVIGPHYCAQNPINLMIELGSSSSSHPFTVKDNNGTTLFILLKPKLVSFHHHRVLGDAAKNPICTLRKELLSRSDQWQVFMGGSKEEKDLLFTVKRPNINSRNEFHVFLASNTEENEWDFKVEGNLFERSFTTIATPSTNIAMIDQHNNAVGNNLTVRVEAHVDYAFIAALLAILNETKQEGSCLGY